MTIRNKPNYGIYTLNLNAAGQQDLPIIGTRIVFVRCVDVAGNLQPGLVNVQIGRALGDAIPFGVNTKVNVDDVFDFVRLSWPAQAGLIATFLVDDDREGAGVAIDSPTSIFSGSVTDNITEIGGQPVDIGKGAAGPGTLRVAVANDGGVGNGAANANTPRVSIANDSGVNPLPGGNQANLVGDSSASGAPGASTTIVAPAANVNGIIVRGNSAVSLPAAGNSVGLFTGTVAPTTAISNEALILISGIIAQVQLGHDIFIPAGKGLYFWTNAASSGFNCSYKLL